MALTRSYVDCLYCLAKLTKVSFLKSRVLDDPTNNGRYAEFYKKNAVNKSVFTKCQHVRQKIHKSEKMMWRLFTRLKIEILYVMIFIRYEPKCKSTAMLRTFKSEGQPLLWNPRVHLLFAMGILQRKTDVTLYCQEVWESHDGMFHGRGLRGTDLFILLSLDLQLFIPHPPAPAGFLSDFHPLPQELVLNPTAVPQFYLKLMRQLTCQAWFHQFCTL